MTQYQSDYGAKAPLPPAALALNAVRKSERDPGGFTAANLEMEQAITHEACGRGHATSSNSARCARARSRMRCWELEPSMRRASSSWAPILRRPTENKKVRVELSLK